MILERPFERGCFWLGLAVLAGALAGCSRDPQVVKQKHFDKGMAYFEEGQYREAEIEFENAIQIDSQFAQAHYKLAHCYLKVGAVRQAYQELAQTVEIAPDNLKTQLDLANLLLAGGKSADAHAHAETVL